MLSCDATEQWFAAFFPEALSESWSCREKHGHQHRRNTVDVSQTLVSSGIKPGRVTELPLYIPFPSSNCLALLKNEQ